MKPTLRSGGAILVSHGGTQRHPAYPSCVRKTEQRAEASSGSCVLKREPVPGRERGIEDGGREGAEAGYVVLCSQSRGSGNCTIFPHPWSSPWQPHLPWTPELDVVLRSEASLQGSLVWGCPDWSPAVQNLRQHPEHLGREPLPAWFQSIGFARYSSPGKSRHQPGRGEFCQTHR